MFSTHTHTFVKKARKKKKYQCFVKKALTTVKRSVL